MKSERRGFRGGGGKGSKQKKRSTINTSMRVKNGGKRSELPARLVRKRGEMGGMRIEPSLVQSTGMDEGSRDGVSWILGLLG